ncbi:MAG: TolC family protein ['Candidatus Kapabacteria' thiocyanatum]|nr:TolC family protein ['Candidatus Kapabacteria' thiocyanatum]
MKRPLLSFVFLLATAAASVSAQVRGTSPVYSLEDCLRIAAQNNVDIRVADASTHAAAAGLTAAFGNYLPGASISANYSRQLTNLQKQFSFVNGVPIQGEPLPNNYGLSAGLTWTVFDGMRREANYDQARNTLDAADKRGQSQRLQIGVDVRRQYVEVLRSMQVVKTRRENVDLSRNTLDRIKAQYDAGRTAITSVYSQETELANQEFELVRSENDLNVAKARLLFTMGLNPDEPAEFLETSFPSSAEQSDVEQFRQRLGSLDACVARALGHRPDIAAARHQASAAESGIAIARGTYFPTLNASGGYAWRNTEIANFDRQGQVSLGLQLSVPIFDQFQTNANIQNASLTLTQRQADVQRLELQVRQSIQGAFLTLEAAERMLEITSRALKAAEINQQAALERFNVGSANQLDVLTATNQLVVSRINRISAVYSYYDARYQAEFASGLMTAQ